MAKFFEVLGILTAGAVVLIAVVYLGMLAFFAFFINRRNRHDHP